MRPPRLPPIPERHWRRGSGGIDDEFVRRCMARWDRGLNTAEIAHELFEKEAIVDRAIWTGLQARHRGVRW